MPYKIASFSRAYSVQSDNEKRFCIDIVVLSSLRNKVTTGALKQSHINIEHHQLQKCIAFINNTFAQDYLLNRKIQIEQ